MGFVITVNVSGCLVDFFSLLRYFRLLGTCNIETECQSLFQRNFNGNLVTALLNISKDSIPS